METAAKVIAAMVVLTILSLTAVAGSILGGVMGFFVFPVKMYNWLMGEEESKTDKEDKEEVDRI